MTSEFELRQFSIEDTSQVVDLLQEVSSFQLSPLEAQNSVQKFIGQHGTHAFVAIKGGKIIGFGSVITFLRVRGGRTAVIEDMVVAKTFQGKGVGKQIIAKLIISAQSEGCFKVSLESSDNAQAFYLTEGFEYGGQAMKLFL